MDLKQFKTDTNTAADFREKYTKATAKLGSSSKKKKRIIQEYQGNDFIDNQAKGFEHHFRLFAP